MRALIITDIQYDFLPGGALAVADGDQIIPVMNSIVEKFPLVVATQDWHPQNHGSFASNHAGRKPFDVGQLKGMQQVLWPDHCVQGQKGAELSSAVNTLSVEAIFRKGTNPEIDSYSGFFDNARLKSTGLADYLKGREVKDIYLGGLAADYCVGFSALDALDLGFNVFVIEDATKAIDNNGWQQMKTKIIGRGGQIIMSQELD
jgi:nicotinamidase/pyrazinamidase